MLATCAYDNYMVCRNYEQQWMPKQIKKRINYFILKTTLGNKYAHICVLCNSNL